MYVYIFLLDFSFRFFFFLKVKHTRKFIKVRHTRKFITVWYKEVHNWMSSPFKSWNRCLDDLPSFCDLSLFWPLTSHYHLSVVQCWDWWSYSASEVSPRSIRVVILFASGETWHNIGRVTVVTKIWFSFEILVNAVVLWNFRQYNTYIYTYMYVYICMYVCMYIYVYIYMYTQINGTRGKYRSDFSHNSVWTI